MDWTEPPPGRAFGGKHELRKLTRLDRIARAGFLARAIVYVLLGWIVLQARQRADEGQNAVFDALRDMPAGWALIIITAIGLFAYGLYRLATALLDLDHKGHSFKGLAKRAGALISGLTHSLLGYTALLFLSDLKKSQPTDKRSHEAARELLDLPLGSFWVIMVGLYFALLGVSQARRAWTASFMDEIAADAPPITCTLGRLGHFARAIVFAVIAWSFVRSGWLEDEDKAFAIGGALASLRNHSVLYLIVASGLIVFGLFSLILARYRIVPPLDMVQVAKRAAS